METSSRKQSFSQALSIAIPEADGLTGTWARVPGTVVPFPELLDRGSGRERPRTTRQHVTSREGGTRRRKVQFVVGE